MRSLSKKRYLSRRNRSSQCLIINGFSRLFRRFASLNAQDLLYMQAEIRVLELKLRQQEISKARSGNERQTWYSRDWQTLSKAEEVEGTSDTQWQTFLDIREKLAKYSKSVSPCVDLDIQSN